MTAKRTNTGSAKRRGSEAVDPRELETMLALGAPRCVAPSPGVRAALMARVRASASPSPTPVPQGWRFESTTEEQGWRGGTIPGVRFKTLSIDEARDTVMVLIEMAPGARFPDHVHDMGGDEGIVITGDVITGGRLLRAGDYYHAAEGTSQTNTVSPSGCTALVSLTARSWKQWQAVTAARE